MATKEAIFYEFKISVHLTIKNFPDDEGVNVQKRLIFMHTFDLAFIEGIAKNRRSRLSDVGVP